MEFDLLLSSSESLFNFSKVPSGRFWSSGATLLHPPHTHIPCLFILTSEEGAVRRGQWVLLLEVSLNVEELS